MWQIGVFGASFNPPTLGHLDVLSQAAKVFDEILLVPSISHAFDKCLAPIADRIAMLEISLQQWDNTQDLDNRLAKIKVSNIEQEILLDHPEKKYIYTYDVLSALQRNYELQVKDCELSFIVGPDIAHPAVWQKFYRYQEIEKNWRLFIAKERVAIHSTFAREIVQKSKDDPLKLKMALVNIVGQDVANYIVTHHLYQARDPQ